MADGRAGSAPSSSPAARSRTLRVEGRVGIYIRKARGLSSGSPAAACRAKRSSNARRHSTPAREICSPQMWPTSAPHDVARKKRLSKPHGERSLPDFSEERGRNVLPAPVQPVRAGSLPRAAVRRSSRSTRVVCPSGIPNSRHAPYLNREASKTVCDALNP